MRPVIILLTLLAIAVGEISASAIRSEQDLLWYYGHQRCLKIDLREFWRHDVEVTIGNKTNQRDLVSCHFIKEKGCHKCDTVAQGISAKCSCDELSITVFNVTKAYDTISVQGVGQTTYSRHYNITDDCNGGSQTDLDNGTNQTDLDNGTNQAGLSTGEVAGIVAGVFALVLMAAVALFACHVRGRRQQDSEAGAHEMANGDPQAVHELFRKGHNGHQDDGFLQNGQAR